jgi:hypothetical protein
MLDHGSIGHGMADAADVVVAAVAAVTADAADRENDWKELHWRLRSLAQQRVALEAEEASYLLEAEETRLYKRLGYSTMAEYMERELHYGPHAANERLRVARELLDLPLIAEQFRAGELSFSAVRELTRVATRSTEEAFLAKAHNKTARDVERMVSGLRRGDDPDAKPDLRLIKKRMVLEVSLEVAERFRLARTALDKERGERVTDSDVLATLLRWTEGATDDVPRPAVQIAVTTCKTCKRSFVGAEQIELDPATAARFSCDAEDIGDLESDAPTRVKPTIPAAIRRKVFHRDGFACVVPGCRARRHLDVHHVVHRKDGGKHSMAQLCVLCSGHHQQLHLGRLVIRGRAPDLTFRWRPDDDVESATTSPLWDEDEPPVERTNVRS